METSQGVKTVLIQQAETGVRKLLESLQSIEEGDLKGLEQQVLETAQRLAATGKVDMLRAGIWKPRTRPGSFEGTVIHVNADCSLDEQPVKGTFKAKRVG